MTPFLTYNADGVIQTTGSAPNAEMAGLQIQPGTNLLVGAWADMERNYVDVHVFPPVVADKVAIVPFVADLLVTGLPVPCRATVGDVGGSEIVGSKYEVGDGEIVFSANLPGAYWLRIEALHHVPTTLEIIVH